MDYEKTNSMEQKSDSPNPEMEKPMDTPEVETKQSPDPKIAHDVEDGEVDLHPDGKTEDENGKHGHVLVWVI